MSNVPTTTNGGAPERSGTVNGWIEHQIANIGRVLPKHLTPDRFARLIFGEVKRNPDIVRCIKEAPDSVIHSMLVAAQLGLEPGPALGQIWFIPRNAKVKVRNERGQEVEVWRKELTYQLGYKGLCALGYRSDQIALIDADVVYACDRFRVRRGTDPGIEHDPDYTSTERTPDKIIAAYAVVQLKGGGKTFRVLPRAEIEDRRKRNDAEKKGYHSPWKSDYAAMARKCALKALFQGGTVPLASEWAHAVAGEDDGDREIIDVTPGGANGSSNFHSLIGMGAPAPEALPEPDPGDAFEDVSFAEPEEHAEPEGAHADAPAPPNRSTGFRPPKAPVPR